MCGRGINRSKKETKREKIVGDFAIFYFFYRHDVFLFSLRKKNCGEVHFKYKQVIRKFVSVYVMKFYINICFFKCLLCSRHDLGPPLGHGEGTGTLVQKKIIIG